MFIESFQKLYYCPLKDNRRVDDAGGERPYQRMDTLDWSVEELAHGKRIKLRGFPKDHKVQLFRVEVSTHRTDYVVTNDQAQDSLETTYQMGRTVYQLKHGLLDNYLIQQLRNPSLRMVLA